MSILSLANQYFIFIVRYLSLFKTRCVFYWMSMTTSVLALSQHITDCMTYDNSTWLLFHNYYINVYISNYFIMDNVRPIWNNDLCKHLCSSYEKVITWSFHKSYNLLYAVTTSVLALSHHITDCMTYDNSTWLRFHNYYINVYISHYFILDVRCPLYLWSWTISVLTPWRHDCFLPLFLSFVSMLESTTPLID